VKQRLILLLAGGVIGLAGVAIAKDPTRIRLAIAALIICTLAVVSVRSPRTAVLIVLCFLPLLGLTRRLLIPIAGWTSWDPLLLVSPIVCVVLMHRLFIVEKRRLAEDVFSKLLLGLLLVALFESLNPAGGSVLAGLTGLLFLPAPLAWFFVGRELLDRQLANMVLTIVVVAGVVVAIYGVWQTTLGFPSWDTDWITINLGNGYVSLSVLGRGIRAFGTFSNSAEYATFLGVAFVIAFVALLHRQRLAMLALPFLGYALFLSSVRATVVLVLLASAVAAGMHTRSLGLTLVSTLCVVAVTVGTIYLFGPQLTDLAARTGNPFIEHQVAGLMNPLDPTVSTAANHEEKMLSGVTESLNRPLGLGLAATNPHGFRLAATTSAGTEIDVSDAFVSLGPLGGILFLSLILVTFLRAGRLALSNLDVAAGAVVGVFIVTLGQWLNGNNYAVAPLVWVLVGWVNATWLQQRVLSTASKATEQAAAANRWTGPPLSELPARLASAGGRI
jgi:hypothetical protein